MTEPAPAATTETPPAATATDAGPTPPREGSPLATAGAGDKPEGEVPPPAEEEKPDGEKPDGEKVEEKSEEKGEPLTAEAISAAITLPEGAEADKGLMDKFSTFAADAKLTQEQAQSLADIYFEGQESLVNQLASVNQKAWDTTIDGWKAELEADPVIGGDKSPAAMEVIGKVLDEYGTPEARRAFEVTGAGWNPHIARFMHKMALALTEGGPVIAPSPTKAMPKTLGSALYDGKYQDQPAS